MDTPQTHTPRLSFKHLVHLPLVLRCDVAFCGVSPAASSRLAPDTGAATVSREGAGCRYRASFMALLGATPAALAPQG